MPHVLHPDPFRPVLFDSPALLVTPEQVQNIKEILDICCSDSRFAEKAYLALQATLNPEEVIPPVITSLSPSTTIVSAPVSLVITGTGFGPDSSASFGGVDAGASFVSDTSLTAEVTAPAVEGPVPVTVTSNGVTSDPVDFTVTALALRAPNEVKDKKNFTPPVIEKKEVEKKEEKK